MASVRPLTPGDRDAWDPLWAGYLAFYAHALASEVTDDTFARACERRDGVAGLVAVDDGGAVVGFAHTVTHPSTWTSDRYVYLEDLFVAPAARGQGAARALIEAVYEDAGGRHVYWHTQAHNATARRLYDRVARDSGFVVYERD